MFIRGPPCIVYKNPKPKKKQKNVTIDPQEYVYQGFPSIMPKKLQKHRYRARLLPSTIYKNSKNIERTLICWTTIKTQKLTKNVKKNLRNTFSRGPPL